MYPNSPFANSAMSTTDFKTGSSPFSTPSQTVGSIFGTPNVASGAPTPVLGTSATPWGMLGYTMVPQTSVFGSSAAPQTSVFGSSPAPQTLHFAPSPAPQTTLLFDPSLAPQTTPLFAPSPAPQTTPLFTPSPAPQMTPLFAPSPAPQTPPFGSSSSVFGQAINTPSLSFMPTPSSPTNRLYEYSSYDVEREHLLSISAKDAYCNKSHEELRSEHYKNEVAGKTGSVDFSRAAQPSGFQFQPPNYAPNNSWETLQSTAPPQCNGVSTFKFNHPPNVSLENFIKTTNPSVGDTLNCIIPAFGANNLNGLNLEQGTAVVGFPVFIPAAFSFIPQQPQVSYPPITPTAGVSSTHNPFGRPNNANVKQGSNPAGSLFALSNSCHCASSTGILGGQSSHMPAPFGVKFLSPFSETQQAKQPADCNSTSHSNSLRPESLKLIVETLGVDPWAENGYIECSHAQQFLPCKDASNDADIIALAEFAVEQHNAMDKESKVEFLKVEVACLEAVDGGRYHIVLEGMTNGPFASGQRMMYYAAVLRKKSDRPNHLTLLERWLPGISSFKFNPSAF